MLGQSLALFAGLCAASASICAKIAMKIAFEKEESTSASCRWILSWLSSDILESESENSWEFINWTCESMIYYIGIAFFVLVFVFNALMWTLFVKSLQKCKSSIEATVTNTASNLFFSAIIGWLFFGETLTLLWWTGASFIIIGLTLIHHGNSTYPSVEDTEKKQL